MIRSALCQAPKNCATRRSAKPVTINPSPVSIPLFRKFGPGPISGHDILRHDQARAEAMRNRAYGRAGQSPVTISLTRKFNPTSGHNLLKHGQARAQALKNPLPESFNLSSGHNIPENDQACAHAMGNHWSEGNIILGVISSFFGVASPKGFHDIDGVLSVGPVDLTVGNLFRTTTSDISAVKDNLAKQGVIHTNQIGVFFAPTTQPSVQKMETTWGGIDSSKVTSQFSFTPSTKTSPASKYWGIDQSIRYGTSTNILSSTAGIVDVGTTLILLATDAFMEYKSATGAVPDETTGLLRINPENYANLESLFFTTNGVTFELTKNAQTWPRSLNTAIGGEVDDIYLIVGDIGSPSGEGLDFINGCAFLERFYSAFDTTNKQVGFATTAFTYATSN